MLSNGSRYISRKNVSLGLDLTECLGGVNMASDLLDLQEHGALHCAVAKCEASAIVRVDWNSSGRRLACARNNGL
jgi:hypothetical protein